MKKNLAFAVLFLFAAVLPGTETLPRFRFTKSAPFANGKIISAKWKNTDTLHGFVEARGIYSIASAQTTVQGLFDEKNLYLTIRGSFDPRFRNERKDKGLFSSNNFEIFFQPQEGGHYIQLAVDDKGRLYTAYGREETKFSGTKTSVTKGKNFWIANLVIPFADLKMAVPKADQIVRFCVMRTNYCTWNGKEEVSAYTPLNWNFHLPDLWAKVLMTRKEGQGKKVMGPNNGIQVNLIPNAEFDIPFKTSKNVERTETMAMSGEWILRASGSAYQFHQVRPFGFKANTQYTLRIKARNIGNDGNLRLIQLRRVKGKIREGVYIAMNLSLGPQFHEYFLPFKTSSDEPWSIVLYKVGGKTPGTGVEIASIKAYEGKISSFEIRKLGRAGNQKAVTDTIPEKQLNFYGKTAVPLSLLAIVNNKYGLREPLDLFEGTGIKYHTLVTTGKNQDIYETDHDPAEIREYLEKNKNDVYFVGSNTLPGIGKDLYNRITASVKKGAGLYVGAHNNTDTLYRELVRMSKGKLLPSSASEKQASPAGMYRPTARDNGTAVDGMKKGFLGKGQVLFTQIPKPLYGQPFKVKMHSSDIGRNLFPLDKYGDAFLMRLAILLSGKSKVLLEKMDIKDNRIVLSSTSLPAGTQILWSVADKHGNKVAGGKEIFNSKEMSVALPVSASGKHIASVHAVKDGKTLDYTAKVFENKARISSPS